MNKKQILREAVQKAVDNGYDVPYSFDDAEIILDEDDETPTFLWDDSDKERKRQMRDIIFDPEFAQAFWGEEIRRCTCGGLDDCPTTAFTQWEWHLQQMAIEPDQLTYLAKFL